MASYEGAEARIRYVIGWGSYRATPATITGQSFSPGRGPVERNGIYSYRLRIAHKTGIGWAVCPDDSTPTTNRHIRAMRRVLAGAGYVNYGTDDRGWALYAREV